MDLGRLAQTIKSLFVTHRKAIQYVVVSLIFLLVGLSIYLNWQELAAYEWQLDVPLFAVSLLLVSLVALSVAIWWVWSIRLMDRRLAWRKGIRIWTLAQLAKYLPGGVWNYASRVYACDREGVPTTHAAVSLVIETVLRIQAAIAVFFFSFPWWPHQDWSVLELLLLISVLLSGFVILSPRILRRIVNWGLRLLRRPSIDLGPLSHRDILMLLSGHIATVAGAGFAFYLMINSIYRLPLQAAVPLTGMLSISVILGFLNPLTPHGLGTREGLLVFLLGYYLPLPVGLVIALLSRIWLTISELLGLVIASLLSRTG